MLMDLMLFFVVAVVVGIKCQSDKKCKLVRIIHLGEVSFEVKYDDDMT